MWSGTLGSSLFLILCLQLASCRLSDLHRVTPWSICSPFQRPAIKVRSITSVHGKLKTRSILNSHPLHASGSDGSREAAKLNPFAKAITEAVRCNYEKHFVGSFAVLVDAEARVFFFQAIRLQFIEGCFGIINFKETSFLGRVASILGQTYLNAISTKDSRPTGRIFA